MKKEWHEIVRDVELVSVQLISSRSVLKVPASRINPEMSEIESGFKFDTEFKITGNRLHCFPVYNLILTENPATKIAESVDLLAIDVQYQISFSIGGDLRASQSQLQEFANSNAIFLIFPYIREYIENQFSRMNLPKLVLPLVKPNLERKEISQYESGKSHDSDEN